MKSLFDLEESLNRKDSGMELAAGNRCELLELARKVAITLGQRQGEVTADDVSFYLEQAGYNPEDLGPAAGSLFRADCWHFTGQRVKSARKKNHARELKVWRYKSKQ